MPLNFPAVELVGTGAATLLTSYMEGYNSQHSGFNKFKQWLAPSFHESWTLKFILGRPV